MAKILIVDDEPDLASAFGRYFERTGHDVLRAGTGAEAIAFVESEHPALMLLDLKLPDMTGFDVLERTRDQRPVVMMVTGHGDVALAVQAMQAGAEGFLTKPVELAHLGAVVDRALEKAQLRDLGRAAGARIGTRVDECCWAPRRRCASSRSRSSCSRAASAPSRCSSARSEWARVAWRGRSTR